MQVSIVSSSSLNSFSLLKPSFYTARFNVNTALDKNKSGNEFIEILWKAISKNIKGGNKFIEKLWKATRQKQTKVETNSLTDFERQLDKNK